MSNSCNNFEETDNIITNLFKTMDDSPASSSLCGLTKQWLKSHDNYFTGFVDGCWVSKSVTSDDKVVKVIFAEDHPATVKIGSFSDIEAAATNASKGFSTWQQCSSIAKAKVLYRIAEVIEQQNILITGVGNLSNSGRNQNQINVPYLINSFNYCAGLVGDEDVFKKWNSTGVVCFIYDDICSSSAISVLWQIPALLAAGNSILFLVADNINLTPFLLAELFTSAGLPPGMFNALFCDKSSFSSFPKVNKLILSSYNQQYIMSAASSCLCIPFDCLHHRSVTVIVYESADLDAAVSNILEMLNVSHPQKNWLTCKLYLQESIQKHFIGLLTRKAFGALKGNRNNPSFYLMSNEIVTSQLYKILSANADKQTGLSLKLIKSVSTEDDEKTPAVIISVDNKAKESQVSRDGPGVSIEIFRTVKESINMFNLDKKAPNVSIWTEEMYLAFEVAHKLKSGTIWINSQNLYEPSVAHSSVYLGGSLVFGGKEGVFNHLNLFEKKDYCKTADLSEIQSYGAKAPTSDVILKGSQEEKKIKKYVKLFIGGSFTNSTDNSIRIIPDIKNEPYASVSNANKSDVDKAVLGAQSSVSKWENCLKSKRGSIFRKASDALTKRKDEFVSELCSVSNSSKEICAKEVETAANVLFFWANHVPHLDNQVIETKQWGKVLQESYSLGVIGIQCPDREPLLSFIFLIAPAIIMGNTVVAIASEKYPTCVLKMCEVFQSAGLPSGVLNVIAGHRSILTRHLASHLSVDAIWFSVDGEKFIYNSRYAFQPKRVFNCENISNSLDEAVKSKLIFESRYSKAVYIPMGTGFA